MDHVVVVDCYTFYHHGSVTCRIKGENDNDGIGRNVKVKPWSKHNFTYILTYIFTNPSIHEGIETVCLFPALSTSVWLECVIDWLICVSHEFFTNVWLVGWLVGWLIDWLIDWLVCVSHEFFLLSFVSCWNELNFSFFFLFKLYSYDNDTHPPIHFSTTVCVKVMDNVRASMSKDNIKNKPLVEAAIGTYCHDYQHSSTLTSREKNNLLLHWSHQTGCGSTIFVGLWHPWKCVNGSTNPIQKFVPWNSPSKPNICNHRMCRNYSVKQLKSILADRNVECKGCIEKEEFIQKIKETEHLNTHGADEFLVLVVTETKLLCEKKKKKKKTNTYPTWHMTLIQILLVMVTKQSIEPSISIHSSISWQLCYNTRCK